MFDSKDISKDHSMGFGDSPLIGKEQEMNKVLVTYASKYGSTREIAERVGEILGQAGLQVDVLPIICARDLSAYPVVVLGSAIYIGKWPKEAVEFLRSHERALAERSV